MAKRKVINVSTLEVFESLKEAAEHYRVSRPSVFESIHYGFKIKGNNLEYFEEWLQWPAEKKERYTRRNNIYFL